MHWGHAVSTDLLKWRWRPAALAPDSPADIGGCFSGSAAVLPDGRHLLMYTGLTSADKAQGTLAGDIFPERGEEGPGYLQVQNIALGDGTEYVKYEGNPVITGDMLPQGLSPFEFRDPKIIAFRDGTFGALTVSRGEDGLGRILLYRSGDGFSWRFSGILLRNSGRFGTMWECPDFFEMDGKWFLVISPMEMSAKEPGYHNGYGTLVMAGSFDEKTLVFTPEYDQSVDYGIDFYAAQSVLSRDGRRIMVGWMQNWESISMRGENAPWAGQMTLPRELSFRDGRLYQQPVRELARYYGGMVFYRKVPAADEFCLYGVEGRMIDLDVSVSPAPGEPVYRCFAIRFAMDGDHHCEAGFYPEEGIFAVDRRYAGSRKAVIHQQSCPVPESMDGNIRVRMILDRYSVEIFINEGRYVMSVVFYTDLCADQISFRARGKALTDVSMREIVMPG